MANSISMADLLAKQDSKSESKKSLFISRGQEVEGQVVAILEHEIILDLGTKSEGVLPKKDLSPDQIASLKVSDKLISFVIQTENDSGQVVLGSQRALPKGKGPSKNWDRFQRARDQKTTLKGRGLEVNKGGLVVEIEGVRGFLPSSQVTLSQAANIDELVGKDLDVIVLELDPNQNRLIFSQKVSVSDEIKKKLSNFKQGDKVEGVVAAVLPFGIFVTLEGNVEGLVHISELSWDKVEDPGTLYKVGDKVSAQVVLIDESTGRANLSVKQLSKDPFSEKAKNLQPEDVVKGTVVKVTPQGVMVNLEGDIEGFVHSSKMEAEGDYPVGKAGNFLVDSIDTQKRRVNLVPFITSTKDLIYK